MVQCEEYSAPSRLSTFPSPSRSIIWPALLPGHDQHFTDADELEQLEG